MILYLDTSALLKRYFKEPHSNELLSKWKEANQIVTSSVAYAETMASFYRKKREVGLNSRVFNKLVNSFHLDWETFIRVEVNDDLNEAIHKVVAKHPLRGFDAIHLASAIITYERISEVFLFACFDEKLINGAQMEGLATFPATLSPGP
jgi:predicted nucleic acid-binding protein